MNKSNNFPRMETVITAGYINENGDYEFVDAGNDDKDGIIRITLHGNDEYVRGFVCQLIGTYQSSMNQGGHDGDALVDTVLTDGRTWHFDESAQEALNKSHCRYIMFVPDFEEYGVILTTNDIESFIAGMRALPATIQIPEEDGLRTISQFPGAANWEQQTRYIDINDFPGIQDENDDPDWSEGNQLATVPQPAVPFPTPTIEVTPN